jgi:hypothetical protein
MSVSLQFYKIFNIYMHNDHNMKKSDLQKIIREAIDEVINEETFAGIASLDDLKKNKKYASLTPDAKKAAETELQGKGVVTLEEDNIDELANVAVRYELNPDAAAADFTGKKARIVAAMQATEEPMSKMDVAGALGYDKQNPINADFMALVADGTIIPSGAQAAPRLNRPATAEPEGEEVPAGEEGPEGGVAGDMSDEEIEASFAKAMGSGDEEPEAGEIETSNISAASMSDEDYEAFMQYTDLESRLAKLKSDILKTKRSRGGVVGDIGDQSSSSIDNMRALKDKLQKKMDDLLASSEYLQKRQAKMTGKKYEPETTSDEVEPLDEWTKSKLQYYAGIKK